MTWDSLYKKYSRADVCRILNWEIDCSSTMYGCMIKNGQCPIFVTYHKSEDISATTMYREGFEDKSVFNWMSKSNRTMESDDVRQILSASKNGMKLPLFIKKSDSEGLDFYYMGQSSSIPEESKQTMIDRSPVVGIPLRLSCEVPDELLDYLTAERSNTEVQSDS